jgi:homoserine dehydrogenase
MQQVNLGLVGLGTVGTGVYQAIHRNGALMASRLGIQFNVAKVAVRDLKKTRSVRVPEGVLTDDWESVVKDPKIDLVIELMGGVTTAKSVVLGALRHGKPVLTANKALLSAHGEELFASAGKHEANLYYEASVAGGMKLEKAEFGDVLAEAQRLGYAEAEPSLDIDAHDAAHKIGILASLSHGFWVNPKDVYFEGIRHVTSLDIQFAGQLGYTIKLLGVVKKHEAPGRGKKPERALIQVSVYPTLVPNGHVLANVNHVFNAILVRGDVVGDTLYYGRGAGQDATASAVLSDLADAALDLKCGSKNRVAPFVPHEQEGSVLPIDDIVSRYYVRLNVIDRPGTLARIATILARSKIGISSVIQPEGHIGESVPLILMIHDAPYRAMRRALAKIKDLSVVKGPPAFIRVESFD